MSESRYDKILQRAFRLLAYRARTIEEMRERLGEKEWADPETVEQVIARLRELNYLNDAEYATSFASTRLSLKPLGPTRLRRDLQRRKLSRETVESALSEAYAERSEEQLLTIAINKQIRLKGYPGDRNGWTRLLAYLIRRGFSYDLVVNKIREVKDRGEDPPGE